MGRTEIFVYIYVQSLRKILNNQEIHWIGSILLQDTAGSTGTMEYIKYLLDSEGITRIFGKIIKSSSEMVKIARPAQETPNFLGQLLCNCMLIEKLTTIFHSDF